MFVEGMLKVAREKLVTIAADARLIEAAKLLSSGTDLVIVCDSGGTLRGVVTKTDIVRQSAFARARPGCARPRRS